jgi:hypothetical protein
MGLHCSSRYSDHATSCARQLPTLAHTAPPGCRTDRMGSGQPGTQDGSGRAWGPGDAGRKTRRAEPEPLSRWPSTCSPDVCTRVRKRSCTSRCPGTPGTFPWPRLSCLVCRSSDEPAPPTRFRTRKRSCRAPTLWEPRAFSRSHTQPPLDADLAPSCTHPSCLHPPGCNACSPSRTTRHTLSAHPHHKQHLLERLGLWLSTSRHAHESGDGGPASCSDIFARGRGHGSNEHFSPSIRGSSLFLSAFRYRALTLIHRCGFSPMAATRRHGASHSRNAFALLFPRRFSPQSFTGSDLAPNFYCMGKLVYVIINDTMNDVSIIISLKHTSGRS